MVKGGVRTCDFGGKNVCLGEESSMINDVLISMTELFLTVTIHSNYSHKSDSFKIKIHLFYHFTTGVVYRDEVCSPFMLITKTDI